MVQKLEAEGLEADLWVNGSFLTKKIDPEDADIALRISEAALVGAMPNQKAALDWFSTAQTKQYFHCHCFMFCEVPAGHSWHPGFDIRQYWIDEYGKSRRNEPKGIEAPMCQECSIATCQAAEVRASRERWSAIRAL